MRQSILLRIASDPIARIWSGVGDLVIPADIVEASPALYLGGGALVNIPELEQVINGTANRLDITVSGVNTETVALAIEESASVKGAKVHVGNVYFDADWQIDDVEWIAVLRADTLTPARQGSTRSITLSMGTDDTDRSRAPVAFWTDADQRRRSPTDRFFDHIAGISSGTSRRFGPSDSK
jgi:hypothetical protein